MRGRIGSAWDEEPEHVPCCTALCLKKREFAPKNTRPFTLRSSDDLQGISLWISASVCFVKEHSFQFE